VISHKCSEDVYICIDLYAAVGGNLHGKGQKLQIVGGAKLSVRFGITSGVLEGKIFLMYFVKSGRGGGPHPTIDRKHVVFLLVHPLNSRLTLTALEKGNVYNDPTNHLQRLHQTTRNRM
jgi:hypothetical protein